MNILPCIKMLNYGNRSNYDNLIILYVYSLLMNIILFHLMLQNTNT